MFSNADFIAAGSGAALTNLLFCKPGCKVIVFANYPIPYSGFSTIAKHVGVEMIYLIDETKKSDDIKDIHSSFSIDTKRLETILKERIFN